MNFQRRDVLRLGAAAVAVGSAGALAACEPKRADVAADVFDVVVVGGGLSGMTAARDLKRAGLTNFVVLEARDRVGGRSYNQVVAPGLVADAGPTWVGPGQTAILDLLRELEIGTVPNYDTGDTVVLIGGNTSRVPASPSPITNQSFIARMNELARTISISAPWESPMAARYDAMTYADFLRTQSISDDDRLAIRLACMLTFGGYPEEISFLYVLFYIHSAGNYELLEAMKGGAQQDRIAGGTQSVSKKIAADLGASVRLNQPVRRIAAWDAQDGSPVNIETASGTVHARAVILALSPSQSAGIEFAPGLPAMRAALIDNWPRSGSAIKVAVTYGAPFWRAKGLSGQSFSPDGPFIWCVDVSPPDLSKGQLMCFVDAAAMPPKMREERKQAILAAYVKCFGSEAANPIGYVEQDWSQETYTRGCVSPLTPGVLSRFGRALRQPNGRLFWAGTETSEVWMGYMDGAVRAGHRAALEALDSLSRRA